jgi:hypothetical protein
MVAVIMLHALQADVYETVSLLCQERPAWAGMVLFAMSGFLNHPSCLLHVPDVLCFVWKE